MTVSRRRRDGDGVYQNGVEFADIHFYVRMRVCIFPNCIVPTGPPITSGKFLWSDPNAWDHYNYILPSNGDNIYIPKGILLCIMFVFRN